MDHHGTQDGAKRPSKDPKEHTKGLQECRKRSQEAPKRPQEEPTVSCKNKTNAKSAFSATDSPTDHHGTQEGAKTLPKCFEMNTKTLNRPSRDPKQLAEAAKKLQAPKRSQDELQIEIKIYDSIKQKVFGLYRPRLPRALKSAPRSPQECAKTDELPSL